MFVLCVVQPRTAGTQVLVLGLDGAGKTSLMHCFATGSLEQDVSPTQGFNAVSINKEELQIEFLESKYSSFTHAYCDYCRSNSSMVLATPKSYSRFESKGNTCTDQINAWSLFGNIFSTTKKMIIVLISLICYNSFCRHLKIDFIFISCF